MKKLYVLLLVLFPVLVFAAPLAMRWHREQYVRFEPAIGRLLLFLLALLALAAVAALLGVLLPRAGTGLGPVIALGCLGALLTFAGLWGFLPLPLNTVIAFLLRADALMWCLAAGFYCLALFVCALVLRQQDAGGRRNAPEQQQL